MSGNRPFIIYLGDVYSAEASPNDSTISGSFSICNWLEPKVMSVQSNGIMGELRAYASLHPDVADMMITEGQSIQVQDFRNATEDDPSGDVIWQGVVYKAHFVFSGNTELFEIIAYTLADDLLRRIKIHGQVRRNYAQEVSYINTGTLGTPISIQFGAGINGDTITIDTPCIFNPDGEPNATSQMYQDANNGNATTFPIFEEPFRLDKRGSAGGSGGGSSGSGSSNLQAAYWTLKDAVAFLLSWLPSSWAINPTSFNDAALNVFNTNNPLVSNVNVEGKSLAEALTMLLEQHNYLWWIDPVPTGNPAQQNINFAYRGAGTTNTLDMAPRGTSATTSTANCIHVDFTRDATPVVNNINAYGDQIIHTTLAHTNPPAPTGGGNPVLKLIQGWQTSDLTWAFESDGVTVNPFDITFRKNYVTCPNLIVPTTGVYAPGRYWIVNLGEQSNQTLEDLSEDLAVGTNDYGNSIDPRRLEKPELYDQNSTGALLHQEDVVVEMSFDYGSHWAVVDKHWYRIQSEGMGIVFTEPKLEKLGLSYANQFVSNGVNYWQALHDGNLQIRILCAVKSDQRVNANVTNLGQNFPLANCAIYNNPGYKKVVYNPLIDNTIYYTTCVPQQITQDDTAHLTEVVTTQQAATDRKMYSGRAQVLLGDINYYTPGQTITAISNRITFPANYQPTVLSVIYKFPELQAEVIIDNKRIPSLVKAKAFTDADDYRQRKLGVEGVMNYQGGQQVPWIPGDDASLKKFLQGGGTP